MLNSQDLLLRVASSLCGWLAGPVPPSPESAPSLAAACNHFSIAPPVRCSSAPDIIRYLVSTAALAGNTFFPRPTDRPQSGFYDAQRFFCTSPQSGNAGRERVLFLPRRIFTAPPPRVFDARARPLYDALPRWSRSDIGIGGDDDDDDLRLHLRARKGEDESVLREMLLFLPSILPDRPKWWSAPTMARCVIPSDSGADLEIWQELWWSHL